MAIYIISKKRFPTTRGTYVKTKRQAMSIARRYGKMFGRNLYVTPVFKARRPHKKR